MERSRGSTGRWLRSNRPPMHRRHFLIALALGPVAAAAGCRSLVPSGTGGRQRLFFTSAGKTCLVAADGSGLRPMEFDVPGQATWQPGPPFSDGNRVMFLSMEPRRDGPGRPFEEYYTQTPTHLWVHDLDRGGLTENRDPRPARGLLHAAGVARRPSHARPSGPRQGRPSL